MSTPLSPRGLLSVVTLIAAWLFVSCGITPLEEQQGTNAAALGGCTSVSFVITPSDHQTVGRPVTMAATAVCGGSPAEYRFWVRPPFGYWTMAQDYSTASTYVWDTTNLPNGNAEMQVQAREVGSTAPWEATVMQQVYPLTGGVPFCSAVSLTASPPATQAIGSPITLTASCGGVAAEYRFWAKTTGAAWKMLRDYDPAPTLIDDESGSHAGPAQFQVIARAIGSPRSWDATKTIDYTLTGGAPWCSSVALAVTPPIQQTIGQPVTLTATGSCGGGTAEYRFWVRTPNARWQMITDYQPSATWTWTSSATPGAIRFEVDARVVGSPAPWEAYTNADYVLSEAPPSCTMLTASATPDPASVGTTITLTGNATCTQPAEYRFWTRTSAQSAWTLLRDYAASPTMSWDTTGHSTGITQWKVDARGVGTPNDTDVSFAGNVTLTGACAPIAFTASPAPPQPIGTSVTITPTATCTGNAPAEYQVWVKPAGGGWLLLHGWTTAAPFTWSTAASPVGTAQIEVDARAQGNAGTDATQTQDYLLVAPGEIVTTSAIVNGAAAGR